MTGHQVRFPDALWERLGKVVEKHERGAFVRRAVEVAVEEAERKGIRAAVDDHEERLRRLEEKAG